MKHLYLVPIEFLTNLLRGNEGYAIIVGAVLVIVLIYSIFSLKKQVSDKKKRANKPSNKQSKK